MFRFITSVFFYAAILVQPACAQNKKMPDKSIVGTWVLQSVQYEGEQKLVCGKEYSSVKYYGPTGEYACAEITFEGKEYKILPHEYGTFTYNDGVYTEMGRKGNWYMPDSVTGTGQWYNRHDVWKKVKLPEKLRLEIINRCKANRTASPEIQKLIHQYILNKK